MILLQLDLNVGKNKCSVRLERYCPVMKNSKMNFFILEGIFFSEIEVFSFCLYLHLDFRAGKI